MDTEKMLVLARVNVERYLADCVDDPDDTQAIYDEAYTLAFDALHDAGVDNATAQMIANVVAREYAPVEE